MFIPFVLFGMVKERQTVFLMHIRKFRPTFKLDFPWPNRNLSSRVETKKEDVLSDGMPLTASAWKRGRAPRGLEESSPRTSLLRTGKPGRASTGSVRIKSEHVLVLIDHTHQQKFKTKSQNELCQRRPRNDAEVHD